MLMNIRCAWVNKSSYQIPVYNSCTYTKPGGGHTAGGTQIGTLYPNEFYTTVPRDNDNNATYYKIYFRNKNGVKTLGYIETEPGGWSTGYEPWAQYQYEYAYYNSNGSSLVTSATTTINNVTYRVFTVKKAVTARYPNGNEFGTLAAGTKLATYSSTVGQTYNGYMVFHKYKPVGASNWLSLTSSGYGFVNLGLEIGSSPAGRAIW